MARRLSWLSCTILVLALLSPAAVSQVSAALTPTQSKGDVPSGVPAAVVTSGPGVPFNVLLVDKSLQTLYLFAYDAEGRPKFIRSFPVSTGKRKGNKVYEGDRRTPEGIYFFIKVFRDRKITIFGRTAYHLNYPDPFDELDGRQGNGIYLHGTNRPLGSRTTNGCVAMNNEDLDYLSRLVKLNGTPIIISQKIDWIEPGEAETAQAAFRDFIADHASEIFRLQPKKSAKGVLMIDRAVLFKAGDRALVRAPVINSRKLVGWHTLYLNRYPTPHRVVASLWQPVRSSPPPLRQGSPSARRKELIDFLQRWVSAWESRDVGRYMAFYSKRFRAYGMNYRQWRAYKARLAKKYQAIDVQISDIDIKTRGSRAVLTFRQMYVSDKFQDYGVKTLKLVRERGEWKIRRENWKPIEVREARR